MTPNARGLASRRGVYQTQAQMQSLCLCIPRWRARLQSVESSATVTGPIVQVYEFEGMKRLVVALPRSSILVSQEWLTTIAGWTFVSGPKPRLEGSVCENKVDPAGADKSYVLSIKK